MAGTREGGIRSRDKNLATDPDFYRKIGAKGGSLGTTGGFYADRKLASVAGRKGGSVSRRGKTLPKPEPIQAATPHKRFKFFKRSK